MTAPVELSFCIVNTSKREFLLRCLDAVAAERPTLPFATEVLVLDNASDDGSAEAARRHPASDKVIALTRRQGKGESDSQLLQAASGRYGFLLNDDSEVQPGATLALYRAMETRPDAAAAGAELLYADGRHQTSAWRFPSVWTAVAAAVNLHRRFVVQSTGTATRDVDWAQSAALLVRVDAARQIGWFDPQFFVYSDEVDFCKRLRDAGYAVLYVPEARCIHHDQLETTRVPERRIVEFSRNRERYMRKHHGRAAAAVVRILTAWTYGVRAVAAFGLRDHEPRWYWRHVTATLFPRRGEGLREAAAKYNRGVT